MPEVRVDPLTGHRTIIAASRSSRPGAGLEVQPPAPIDPARDPFGEGHEDQTPPELYAVRPDGGAPDPPLEPGAETPERDAQPDLFTALPASGHHEVIVNAPDPVHSLGELSAD